MKRRLVRSSFEQGAYVLAQIPGEKMRLTSGTPPARPPRPETGDRDGGPVDIDNLLGRIEAVMAAGNEALVGAEIVPFPASKDIDLAA